MPLRRNHDIDDLRARDVAHHFQPQQDHGLVERSGGSRIVTHASGSTIHDGDGNAILDAMAGLWCVNIGYGRAEMARAAHDQMLELPFYNSLFKTTTVPTIELASRLAGLLGNDLSHIAFASSGSEANDTLVRLARYYWQAKGEPQRTIIIARTNAYHGSTIAGTSLGGMAAMHAQGGPWVPGIAHIMQPYRFGDAEDGETEAAFAARAARALDDKILELGPHNVAAFIGEPVQGAGGVIIPPPGYWPAIEAICRKHGILLACDEVITGFGRLGSWFGFQHYGIRPDLVTMAKGLSSGYIPIAAVGVSAHIVATLRTTGTDFIHGYTYSGHPTACAVALENLAVIEREDLVERTRAQTGPHLARRLAELALHPRVGHLVGEARSLGLIAAVEIVAEPGTRRRFPGQAAATIVRDHCIAAGVMVRAVRDSIVMSPPLIVTISEIDRIVDTIAVALAAAEPALRSLTTAEPSPP